MSYYTSQIVTRSETNTHTESRASYISDKVAADIFGLVSRGILEKESAIEWMDIVDICLRKNGLEKFQLKISRPGGEEAAVTYQVDSTGTISFDENSGGLDWYEFEINSSVSIVIRRNSNGINDSDINQLLQKYGWTTGASFIEGNEYKDKSYSKDGFGVNRSRIGW
jgi:hypothetical protein